MDEILDNSQDLEQNNLSDINHENSEDIKI